MLIVQSVYESDNIWFIYVCECVYTHICGQLYNHIIILKYIYVCVIIYFHKWTQPK